ncbi:MAG TPA: hypothetical protein VNO52_16215, partial [Methylomirabilota bacterium]|nr:hypothetical protein [Methylomirabilota bacterium]
SAAGPIPAAIAGDDTNKTAVAVPPSEAASLYRLLSDRIHALRQKELDMSAIYSGENPLVIGLRKQIAEVERQKTELEGVYPGLVQTAATATPAASSHLLGLDLAYSDRVAQVAGLEARMRVLTNQLERATVEARAFDQVENSILKLQRQRDLEEARLKRLESSLEQATIDTALDSSKISNISIAQAPSPPVQDSSRRTNSAALAAGAGVLIGLLLALFLDLVLDQSVRRASELERRFRLPVFMTIPVFKAARLWGNGRQRLLWGGGASKQVGTATETVAPPSVSDSPEALRPFYEGLRDRLLLHFENVTRRPKVIALSGCTPGSGATTLAAGLAAALSETGDGNVLLVDLNLDQGAAHPFYRGKQLCGLADILEHEKRGAGLVQDNLFLASATGANGSGHHPVLSKKVVDLMPRLRASDYDYIIFDLPPISPTSVTFRLAGYMDLVLLVVESARTSKHKVRDAMALLGHAKAKVGAILNKQRKYVPEWVHHGS